MPPPIVPPLEVFTLSTGEEFDEAEVTSAVVSGVTQTTIKIWKKLAGDRELVKTIRVDGAPNG